VGLIVKSEVSLNSGAAFKAFNDELSLALHRLGLEFEAKNTGAHAVPCEKHSTSVRLWQGLSQDSRVVYTIEDLSSSG